MDINEWFAGSISESDNEFHRSIRITHYIEVNNVTAFWVHIK
jgi:hypothetical protein